MEDETTASPSLFDTSYSDIPRKSSSELLNDSLSMEDENICLVPTEDVLVSQPMNDNFSVQDQKLSQNSSANCSFQLSSEEINTALKLSPVVSLTKICPTFGKKKVTTKLSIKPTTKQEQQKISNVPQVKKINISEDSANASKENVNANKNNCVLTKETDIEKTSSKLSKAEKFPRKELKEKERKERKAEKERAKEEKKLATEKKRAEREQKRMEKELKKMQRQKRKEKNVKNPILEMKVNEVEGKKADMPLNKGDDESLTMKKWDTETNTAHDSIDHKETSTPMEMNGTETDGLLEEKKIGISEGSNEKQNKEGCPTSDDKKNKCDSSEESPLNECLSNDNGKVKNNLTKKKRGHFSSISRQSKKSKLLSPAVPSSVWVQCDRPDCFKWRLLRNVTDPSQLPDKWYCSMNEDPKYNACSAEEETWSVPDDSMEFIYSPYNLGSLVWAKMEGYPWWPAMIDTDPDKECYYELSPVSSSIPVRYHVVFFDKPVSRGWIHAMNMQPLTEESKLSDFNEEVSYKYQKSLVIALERAHKALHLRTVDRLKAHGFKVLYRRHRKRKLDCDDES